jgi:hypothetical protein
MVNGEKLDNKNLEVSHQHIFYDDNVFYPEANVGFHGKNNANGNGIYYEKAADGNRMTLNYLESNYVCEPAYYDDEIIAQAVKNLQNSGNWTADRYNLIKPNCQDFVSGVLDEYYRLGGSVPVNQPFPEFDMPRHLQYLQSLPPSVPPGFGLTP